jgi:hypothetical protein
MTYLSFSLSVAALPLLAIFPHLLQLASRAHGPVDAEYVPGPQRVHDSELEDPAAAKRTRRVGDDACFRIITVHWCCSYTAVHRNNVKGAIVMCQCDNTAGKTQHLRYISCFLDETGERQRD